MAKPQLEDGYTQIANEILEKLIRMHLSPNQWQVLLCIIRKTYGFHKKVDYIANIQIGDATDLCKAVVSRALRDLENMKVINREGKYIGVQKDWELWEKLAALPTSEPKEPRKPTGRKDSRASQSHKLAAWQAMVFHRDGLTCRICGRELGVTLSPAERNLNAHHIFSWAPYPELRFDVNNGLTMCDECHYCYHYADDRNTYEYITQVFEFRKLAGQLTIEKLAILHGKVSNSAERLAISSQKVSSPEDTQKKKDTITKDTIQKKDILPEWIDKDTWVAFLEMRKKKRATPTERAKQLLVKELEKLRGEGHDPNEVLNQSIMRNYTGVFPLKGGQYGTHRQGSTKLPPRDGYTKPHPNPELDKLVEQRRAVDKLAGHNQPG